MPVKIPKPAKKVRQDIIRYECPNHKALMINVETDDICAHCPEEGCPVIAVKHRFQHLKLGWNTCDKCNLKYVTPVEGKCVACDEDARNKVFKKLYPENVCRARACHGIR